MKYLVLAVVFVTAFGLTAASAAPPVPTATISVVGNVDRGDGWSEIVFQSETYHGKALRLWADCQNAGERQNYTPVVDKKTGRASMPYVTGTTWGTCSAYIFAGDDWQTPISNTVTFTVPL